MKMNSGCLVAAAVEWRIRGIWLRQRDSIEILYGWFYRLIIKARRALISLSLSPRIHSFAQDQLHVLFNQRANIAAQREGTVCKKVAFDIVELAFRSFPSLSPPLRRRPNAIPYQSSWCKTFGSKVLWPDVRIDIFPIAYGIIRVKVRELLMTPPLTGGWMAVD